MYTLASSSGYSCFTQLGAVHFLSGGGGGGGGWGYLGGGGGHAKKQGFKDRVGQKNIRCKGGVKKRILSSFAVTAFVIIGSL